MRPQPTTGHDLDELEREFADACRLHELKLGRPLDARDCLFIARELGYRKLREQCPSASHPKNRRPPAG
jgi:hypothetical protein